MVRPLYADAAHIRLQPGDGHRGLWYEKFCDAWRDNWLMSATDGSSPKLDWVQTVAGPAGQRNAIQAFTERIVRLVQSEGGSWTILTTADRLVTGLGRAHPIESGFVWHHVLGTPYLPGSSVKGVVRSWASEEGRPDVERLFGAPRGVGSVSILDAVPVLPAQLELDVLTPHYGGWTSEDLPADWRSPNPLPFLTTAKGSPFIFGVIPGRRASEADAAQVLEWIVQALSEEGAGAKTAVGYGRFVEDLDAKEQMTRSLREAMQAADEERRRTETLAQPELRWKYWMGEWIEQQIYDCARRVLSEEQAPEEFLRDVGVEVDSLDPPLSQPEVERNRAADAMAAAGWPQRWRSGQTSTQAGARKLKDAARAVERHRSQPD